MFKTNKNLTIIALVAIVNALGYGIIIPILYSYSKRFGLTDFQNGLLFSLFSIFQFISTPIIGRLSDRYGRKPLLLISLFGTVLSFLMMGFAKSIFWLFAARIIDGITAGNISVASAVISDTTAVKDRAKGFGIIGASFGLGFVFGPAISGLTYGLHPTYPFLIAAAISLVSFVITWVFLPETNTERTHIKDSKVFDFGKLFHPIFDKNVGSTLIISLLYSFAFALFIYGFQPFAVKGLDLNVPTISSIFIMIGVIGVIAQMAVIPFLTKKFSDKKIMQTSLVGVGVIFLLLSLVKTSSIFVSLIAFNALFNSFISPLIQTLLSKEMDAKSQGSILGINTSYVGLGNIFGPLIGGVVASYRITYPFLVASFVVLICYLISMKIKVDSTHPEHAF